MTPGQQVALQPALQRVFGQQLHNAAIRSQFAAIVISRRPVGHPGLLAGLVDGMQLVG